MEYTYFYSLKEDKQAQSHKTTKLMASHALRQL